MNFFQVIFNARLINSYHGKYYEIEGKEIEEDIRIDDHDFEMSNWDVECMQDDEILEDYDQDMRGSYLHNNQDDYGYRISYQKFKKADADRRARSKKNFPDIDKMPDNLL